MSANPPRELLVGRLAILRQVSAALDRYPEVVEAIGTADGRDAARLAVQALFGCDAMAARTITDLQLEQLTGMACQLHDEINRLEGQSHRPPPSPTRPPALHRAGVVSYVQRSHSRPVGYLPCTHRRCAFRSRRGADRSPGVAR